MASRTLHGFLFRVDLFAKPADFDLETILRLQADKVEMQ